MISGTGLFVVMLVASMIAILLVFESNTNASAQVFSSEPSSGIKLPEVKISSPSNGASVQIGKPLSILGVSNDDNTTNCQVDVIVNNMKPYRQATARGEEGKADFSRWSFVITGNYTKLIDGPNKITSRISCDYHTPYSAKWYSINVTGVEHTGPNVMMSENLNVKNILPQVGKENNSSRPTLQLENLTMHSGNELKTPLANAGPDQTIKTGTAIKLDGTQSKDLDGNIASYSWVQTSGDPIVPVINADSPTPTLQIPNTTGDRQLAFKLIVVDNDNLSASDSLVVTVKGLVSETQHTGENDQKDTPCDEIGITNLC